MKASEVIEKVFEYGKDFNYTETCDTLKSGSPDAEVSKVAVVMNPSVDVIKAVSEWGADLMIVHEPLYYNHWDSHSDEKIESEKRALLESTGMTVYRFHDHPHRNHPDLISAGEMKYLGLDGKVEYTDEFDLTKVKLKTPMTPVEVAKLVESRLGIKHVRICGTRDVPCTNISTCFGAPGDVMEELSKEETEILMIGEACEWRLGEYARDASQLGYKKTLMILGHVGSERAGMVYITDLFAELLPELEFKYFECGEVCTYTDSQ